MHRPIRYKLCNKTQHINFINHFFIYFLKKFVFVLKFFAN
ncbi:hypothetical protein LDG_8875 [Legionella drancourtii LLAP12]|uniref:Uncharacterized protein n=1 Tax=Legionella drancourtii LLAP12 TaxID=658187 RepID=G9EU82_9GAMM|nr:hypothetical protein LDG_8875 [Legionella drancourtii LLAP12]